MKLFKTIGLTLASASLCCSLQAVAQDKATSLNKLLEMVEESRFGESQEQRDRIVRFQSNANQQQSLLNEMIARRVEEERISDQLEDVYDENELIKAERHSTLQDRLGDLDQLFGTILGVVGDTRTNFESSIISSQYSGREEFLTELADIISEDSDLPSIAELERLWFYMQQEMIESGRIVKFTTDVAQTDGTQSPREVVRIGAYNILSDGEYLNYDSNTGRLSVLARQPDSAYLSAAAELQKLTSGFIEIGIDPTGPIGGTYLRALISSPDLRERFEQGNETGMVIAIVFVIGMLFALERMFSLTIIGIKVKKQLKNLNKINKNNPLGRVLSVYNADKSLDIETLELKLGEAILKEMPSLERFLALLKIIATVAPLLGLLGTVTGMITVFQAITLFGTGDPQIMAGGISGALVTTVMGLIVAIPMVLIHTMLKSRSDSIVHILEEQATGIIARKAEANSSNA